jgi:hypothetical protein
MYTHVSKCKNDKIKREKKRSGVCSPKEVGETSRIRKPVLADQLIFKVA